MTPSPIVTGFATGGIGRSRWKGSNGPEADARVNADVRPRVGDRLSKSNEQTSARLPTIVRPGCARSGVHPFAPGVHQSAARAALAGLPGLALAGAAFDGVGVPACVASGESAAESVLKHLEG